MRNLTVCPKDAERKPSVNSTASHEQAFGWKHPQQGKSLRSQGCCSDHQDGLKVHWTLMRESTLVANQLF
eukprot:4414160-Amphidinium_carterae.1